MKILFLFIFLFIFSCGEEPQEREEKCVYNTKLQRCIDEPCKEGQIRERCYEWYDRIDNCVCVEGCFQRVYSGEIYDYYCENLE